LESDDQEKYLSGWVVTRTISDLLDDDMENELVNVLVSRIRAGGDFGTYMPARLSQLSESVRAGVTQALENPSAKPAVDDDLPF
jgi:hypothetical protein